MSGEVEELPLFCQFGGIHQEDGRSLEESRHTVMRAF